MPGAQDIGENGGGQSPPITAFHQLPGKLMIFSTGGPGVGIDVPIVGDFVSITETNICWRWNIPNIWGWCPKRDIYQPLGCNLRGSGFETRGCSAPRNCVLKNDRTCKKTHYMANSLKSSPPNQRTSQLSFQSWKSRPSTASTYSKSRLKKPGHFNTKSLMGWSCFTRMGWKVGMLAIKLDHQHLGASFLRGTPQFTSSIQSHGLMT